MASDRQSRARVAPYAMQKPGLEPRAQISPNTKRNAAPPAARAIHSPTAHRPQHQDRYCNATGQRNEFPLLPVPESNILRPLRDAGLRLEFVSDELSLAKPFGYHRLNFLFSALATQAGTKPAISPPRRAISLMIRELR